MFAFLTAFPPYRNNRIVIRKGYICNGTPFTVEKIKSACNDHMDAGEINHRLGKN